MVASKTQHPVIVGDISLISKQINLPVTKGLVVVLGFFHSFGLSQVELVLRIECDLNRLDATGSFSVSHSTLGSLALITKFT